MLRIIDINITDVKELVGLEERQEHAQHKVILNHRKSMSIYGVKDVVSFDVEEIIMETDSGLLLVKGNQLHMNHLSLEKGEVGIDGEIDGLTYSGSHKTTKDSGNFFGRLFG